METRDKRRRIAASVRTFRSIHRYLGAFLFIVFLLVSITGLLLGWKKNSNGLIHPESSIGVSTDLANWLSLDTLEVIAFDAMRSIHGEDIDLELNRIDVRPDKGMVKFVFENHYHGLQLDGSTGEVLQLTRRNSDLIENIHDGSYFDKVLNTSGDIIKLIYTTIVGLALMIFSITGFWLWFGPKIMRRLNR